MAFWTGIPDKFEQLSTLSKNQQPLFNQLQGSAMNKGAGGVFGQSADYYRDLLSNDNADVNAMAAPEIRRFNEQTVPGIAHQFAGMGAGNLDSSSFRNASVNAGTDLAERIGAIRAQLRQQGAQGLTNIGQQGLQNVTENVYRPAQPGFLETAAPAIGNLLGTAAGSFLNPAGGAGGIASWLSSIGGTGRGLIPPAYGSGAAASAATNANGRLN